MKVALIFVGRIKGFLNCTDSFKEFILKPLSNHEIDGYAVLNSENKHENLDQFIENYKIKKYENIKLDIDLFDNIPVDKNIGGNKMPLKMYYCWYRAFQLIEETKINYDLIIYLRADQKFDSSLIIPKQPIEDILYVPKNNDFNGLNDQLAYGNIKVMKHYCSIYNNILNIYHINKNPFHTETYVKLHNCVFPIERIKLNYILHPSRR